MLKMKIIIENKPYDVQKCGVFGKIRGLMFNKKKNLLFEINNKKILIHSFFVFFPITLYFLDENFKILEKGILKPFRVYIPKIKAKYFVEIP